MTIGYKIAKSYRGDKRLLIKLLISKNAKTNVSRKEIVDRRFAKLRCNKAKVLSISNLKNPKIKYIIARSIHDRKFIYNVGEKLKIKDYDDNQSKICAPGIH